VGAMSSVTERVRDSELAEAQEPSFEPAEYKLRTSDGQSATKAEWKVRVSPAGHKIIRHVWRDDVPWERCGNEWDPEETVWPTWPDGIEEEETTSPASPLAVLQEYWTTVGNRLRDSAKWMAAVLGAALATVIGTSPLSGMRQDKPQEIAIVLGAAGLVCLGVTLFLVLQVMRPRSVSFTDVQCARKRKWFLAGPLYKWRRMVESQQDLYLPCGVSSLLALRQSMIIEEVTLMALAQAKADARDPRASERLGDAQRARAARLMQLRVAAARIASVGEYYKLRERSSWATYAGVLFGLLGTAAIVAAFAWPVANGPHSTGGSGLHPTVALMLPLSGRS
jgi:hypothetical protein